MERPDVRSNAVSIPEMGLVTGGSGYGVAAAQRKRLTPATFMSCQPPGSQAASTWF